MEIDMEHGTICKKQAHICQCIDMHTAYCHGIYSLRCIFHRRYQVTLTVTMGIHYSNGHNLIKYTSL